MSVQSEIERIEQNIANTYEALNEMGATMPAEQNSNNLASTARTVPQSGGGGGESASNTFIVKLLTSLSASGLSLSLPSDVTYSDVNNAVDNGLHVIAIADIPSAAGDIAGTYAIPFAYKDTSGNLIFSVMVRDMNLCVIITPSGAISFTYFFAEQSGRRVDSIRSSDTHMNYPSAKAVYDFVQNEKQVVLVTFDIDMTTLSVSNFSHTASQIKSYLDNGKKIYCRALAASGYAYGEMTAFDQTNNAVLFGIQLVMAIPGIGSGLFYFTITHADFGSLVSVRLVSSNAMEG